VRFAIVMLSPCVMAITMVKRVQGSRQSQACFVDTADASFELHGRERSGTASSTTNETVGKRPNRGFSVGRE
jgi:hypothetical protein